MLSLRAAGALVTLALLNFKLTTCRSPGEAGKGRSPSPEAAAVVSLPGVDTSNLTAREKREWSSYVTELYSPCPDQPVNIAQCVKESRKCDLCLPAAKFLADRVRKGDARSQVEAAFRTRFAPDQVKSIPTDNSPTKGPADAPVTIVEWADYECPFCGRAAPVLDKLFKKFPGKIRLVFKNYPLSIHQYSESAARAAVAAGLQGKFWQMHDILFKNQEKGLDKLSIEKMAKDIGLDMKKFKADWQSEKVADIVARDRKEGDKLGLDGTPLIYINGRHFKLGQFDFGKDLDHWVELEIKTRTGKDVQPEAVASGAAPAASQAPKAPASGASSASAAPKKPPVPTHIKMPPAPRVPPQAASSSK